MIHRGAPPQVWATAPASRHRAAHVRSVLPLLGRDANCPMHRMPSFPFTPVAHQKKCRHSPAAGLGARGTRAIRTTAWCLWHRCVPLLCLAMARLYHSPPSAMALLCRHAAPTLLFRRLPAAPAPLRYVHQPAHPAQAARRARPLLPGGVLCFPGGVSWSSMTVHAAAARPGLLQRHLHATSATTRTNGSVGPGGIHASGVCTHGLAAAIGSIAATRHAPLRTLTAGYVPEHQEQHIVVVGGGVSAASVVVNLLRLAAVAETPLRVTVVEKEEGRPPWTGVAWATSSPHHVMNVPCDASKMRAPRNGGCTRVLHQEQRQSRATRWALCALPACLACQPPRGWLALVGLR